MLAVGGFPVLSELSQSYRRYRKTMRMVGSCAGIGRRPAEPAWRTFHGSKGRLRRRYAMADATLDTRSTYRRGFQLSGRHPRVTPELSTRVHLAQLHSTVRVLGRDSRRPARAAVGRARAELSETLVVVLPCRQRCSNNSPNQWTVGWVLPRKNYRAHPCRRRPRSLRTPRPVRRRGCNTPHNIESYTRPACLRG